ncbi:MAG: ABC transporter, partial [Hyphomicrobiales bacterium]
FEMRVDGANRGLVEISARIVNDRNGRTVANKVFRSESLSAGTSVDQAVAALNRASDKVFAEMTAWTLKNV